jgi:hypothetical protein
MGYVSLRNVYSGNTNVALGTYSLNSATSGNENVGVGSYTLNNVTLGNKNLALGSRSGQGFLIGDNNVAIGTNVGNDLASLSAVNNTFIAGAGTERFRIDSLGNMGIATTTPNVRLTVNGSVSSNSYIYGNGANLTNITTSIPFSSYATNNSIAAYWGSNSNSGTYSSILGGRLNIVIGNCSVVAGGICNTASGTNSTTGNIYGNSVVGGGQCNNACGTISFIGGGLRNKTTISACYGFIGGGANNCVTNKIGVVVGGGDNCADDKAAVVGGAGNTASGYASFIGGGYGNSVSDWRSAILGGRQNVVSGACSIIGGGCANSNSGTYSSILGGKLNNIDGTLSFIGGGNNNCIAGSSCASSILGGGYNTIVSANSAFILGYGLTANQAGFTYVNNLSSQGAVYGKHYGDGSNLTNVSPTIPFNVQNGLTYNIAISDNGATIASTNTTGLTAIISSSTSYTSGFNVNILQLTTGRITLSAENGFTNINQSNGYFKTTKQYSVGSLIYTGATYGWVLFGDISA